MWAVCNLCPILNSTMLRTSYQISPLMTATAPLPDSLAKHTEIFIMQVDQLLCYPYLLSMITTAYKFTSYLYCICRAELIDTMVRMFILRPCCTSLLDMKGYPIGIGTCLYSSLSTQRPLYPSPCIGARDLPQLMLPWAVEHQAGQRGQIHIDVQGDYREECGLQIPVD